eukprot:EG_transcript_20881
MLPRRLWLPGPRPALPTRFIRGRATPQAAPAAADPTPRSVPSARAPQWGWSALLGMVAGGAATYLLLGAVARHIRSPRPQPSDPLPTPAIPILREPSEPPSQETPPAGWRVLKNGPGEQEMEYDDGHGNRRYIYRRSWGGSFGSKGAEGPDGGHRMVDPYDELRDLLRPFLQPAVGLGLLGDHGDAGPFLGFRPPPANPFFGGGSGVPDMSGLGPEARGDRHFHDFINGDDPNGRRLPRL